MLGAEEAYEHYHPEVRGERQNITQHWEGCIVNDR